MDAQTKERAVAEGTATPPADGEMVEPMNQDIRTPEGSPIEQPAAEEASKTGHPVADLIQRFLESIKDPTGVVTTTAKDDGTTRILKVMDGPQAYWVTVYRQKPKGS